MSVKSFDEQMRREEEVLEWLESAGLKLKPQKSQLLQRQVVFLGHVMSGEWVKPNPIKKEKLVSWPKPKTAKQVKQLVAMGSYCRRYVKGFASIVRQMVELTR